MNCKEAKSLLTSYLLGDLGETLASAIREHVETCESCNAEAWEIQPTLDLLRDALSDTAPAPAALDVAKHVAIYRKKPKPRGRVISWFADGHPVLHRVAATVVICVIIGILGGLLLPAIQYERTGVRSTTLGLDVCMDASPGSVSEIAAYGATKEKRIDAYSLSDDDSFTGDAAVPRASSSGRKAQQLPPAQDFEPMPAAAEFEAKEWSTAKTIALAERDANVSGLEDVNHELERNVAIMGEKLADRSLETKNLKEHIRKLEVEIRRITQPGGGGADTAIVLKPEKRQAGAAGAVIFEVPDLSDAEVDSISEEQTAVTYTAPGKAKAGKMRKGGAPSAHETPEPEEVEPSDLISDAPYAGEDPTATPGPIADFSPQPTTFDAVAIIKSPVIMKGIYGSRSPGAAGAALSAEKPAKKAVPLKPENSFSFGLAEDADSGGFGFGRTVDGVAVSSGDSSGALIQGKPMGGSMRSESAREGNEIRGDIKDALKKLDESDMIVAGSTYEMTRARRKPGSGLAPAAATLEGLSAPASDAKPPQTEDPAVVQKYWDALIKEKDYAKLERSIEHVAAASTPAGHADPFAAPASPMDPFAAAAAPVDVDPFVGSFGGGGGTLDATGLGSGDRSDWKEFFSGFGTAWPEGSSISYKPEGGEQKPASTTATAGNTEAVYYRYLPEFKDESGKEKAVDGKKPELSEANKKRQEVREKLKNIVIPEIDFRQANIQDTLAFLQQQTVAFDKDAGGSKGLELDLNMGVSTEPAQRAADMPVDPFAAAAGPAIDGSEDVPLITFSARYISAQEALDIVTSVANLKYRIDDNGAIKVVPLDSPDGAIVHRMYDVKDADDAWKLLAIDADGRERDAGEDLVKQRSNEFGVGWPRGSSVEYHPEVGKVFVANTPDNLLIFERVLQAVDKKTKEDKQKEATRFQAYGVNPVINVSANAFSTFAIDVDTASYTLARNYIEGGSLPPAEAVRTEEVVNFFDYAYKAPSSRTFAVYAEVAPSKFGQGQHLLKIGVKGKRLGREEQRKAVLTFLIDTSGSMEKPDRIELVKKSLKMLVGKLGDEDLVSIVQYGSRARLVLAHTKASRKKEIGDAIDSLQCSGSTNLEEGMDKAYEAAAKGFVSKGENRVLILSDGVANLGNLDANAVLSKVEKYRKQGIYCSVFGVGQGTYDDVMLETLANKGDGTYSFLDSEEEAKRLFVDDLASTLNTIARDVKIQVEFNRNLVKTYRQLGYENRQLTKEQFRDDTVDAGEVGSGQSVTALYEMGLQAAIAKQGSQRRLAPEPIATVRVRYRRADNDAVEEIEIPVTFQDVVNDFNKTDARFRLAACAAEFAEILRGSPYAQGSDYSDVSKVLVPVALELDLDQRVQGFLRMTTSAPGMSRGK